jgi:Zn-dependent protease
MASSTADMLALAPLWYVAFLFSTVCHEAAHALAARMGGDPTAYAGGQVSLDPIPHIRREPFGLVVVPILTLITSGGMFGWGSAPFDPHWQIRYPRRAALMALAGPVANFVIAIVAGIVIHVGLAYALFEIPLQLGITQLVTSQAGGLAEGLATFLSILFILNVILGVFNLLPVPPLDGYSVLGLALPEDITLRMIEFSRSPGFSILGVFIAWQIFPHFAPRVIDTALYCLFRFL